MTAAQIVITAGIGGVYGFVGGVLVCRGWYLRRKFRHVCPVALEPVRLPRQVNRKAARDAVERRDWADTNHQSRPVQLTRIERPGLHRAQR